jgi:hypothetical protein
MLFTALSLGLFSCSNSTSLDADGEKVVKALKIYYSKEIHDFSEIKLLRNVTAEDSLNFLLKDEKFLEKIIADYKLRLENVQRGIANPYYSGVSVYNVDEEIDKINRYADAFDGIFDGGEWDHKEFPYHNFYKNLSRYKSMAKDKVIAKIYSVTYKRKDGEKWKTEHWVLKPDLSEYITSIKGNDLNPTPKSNFDIQRLKFDHVINENEFMKSYDEE